MGRMLDALDMELETIEEEGGLIMKEEFMTVIFQGKVDDLPTFEK